jgi:hypothetical protein
MGPTKTVDSSDVIAGPAIISSPDGGMLYLWSAAVRLGSHYFTISGGNTVNTKII